MASGFAARWLDGRDGWVDSLARMNHQALKRGQANQY